MTTQRKALIVGLGIAGMSAAIQLRQAGWSPVIVERAPERRTGGYFIALFPEGVAAAERLGVNDAITKRGRKDFVTLSIGADGEHEPGVGLTDQPGGPQPVLRGDIEAGLWTQIDGRIEVRYDTVPTAIVDGENDVAVTLLHGQDEYTEQFDLVVGADGMRSTVRRLVFGPDQDYLKPMGAVICAFQMSGQLPGLAEHEAAIVAESQRSLWVFTLDGTTPTALFSYRTKDIDRPDRPAAEILREVFDGVSAGGLVEAAIHELEMAPHHLFDTVSQVRMRHWHSGRVVLVGDAAWCLSLFSGMGATTGMLGGVTLGDQLAEHPDDLQRGLTEYEKRLRPLVTKHQHLAFPKSQVFVPTGPVAAWIRRRLMRTIAAHKSD